MLYRFAAERIHPVCGPVVGYSGARVYIKRDGPQGRGYSSDAYVTRSRVGSAVGLTR